MPLFYTSNSLIDSVKRRAMIPTSQSTFTESDFLDFSNEEIAIGLVPSILMYHEEYFGYYQEVPLVNDQSEYPIPYRAIGGKLRDLFYKDANGNLLELSQLSPNDTPFWQSQGNAGFLNGFYLKGNSVVLVPPISIATGSLVFSYYLRPNALVKENRVAEIVSINTVSGQIVVDGVPSNISSGGLIDFLETKPGFKTRRFDIEVSSTDTNLNTITFDPDDLPEDLEVGDHIASAQECIIPQVPADLHVVLAQRVAARCLEALGDSQGLGNANTKLQEMEAKTATLIDNRVEGAPRKLNNLKGLLRAGKSKWRGIY